MIEAESQIELGLAMTTPYPLNIEIERANCWNLLSIIKLRLLSGKKPPDEISVKDRLKESNILIPEIDSNKNITMVSIR